MLVATARGHSGVDTDDVAAQVTRDLGAVTRTSSVFVRVAEIQAVNTRQESR